VIVVGDAPPVIAMAAVQQLDLLRHLYAEVLVPDAVRREVLARPEAPGAADLLKRAA
jgi:predicted nucleic acid-binding protein